jgi:hypothetical protein
MIHAMMGSTVCSGAAATTAAQQRSQSREGDTPIEGCVTVLLKQYCISVMKFE